MAVTMHPLGFIGEAEGIETKIYPRQWDCSEAGDIISAHSHGCVHATLVAAGRFRFIDETSGVTRDVRPFEWIPVAAKDMHRFECLEPGTVLCVFQGDEAVRA